MSLMPESLKPILRPIYVPLYNVYHSLFIAPKRYRYLYEYIAKTKAKNIMEVGTWNGERALKMIELAQTFHPKNEHSCIMHLMTSFTKPSGVVLSN